jgi:hypothetical protein
MGREIVYCWKCATRLQTSDFESRQAFRYLDKVSCQDCVYELVADLSAEEQEAVLQGDTGKPASSTKVKPARTGSTQAVKRATGAVPTVREGGPTTRQTKAVPRAETGRRTGAIPTSSRAIKRTTTGSIPKAQPPEEAEEGEVSEDPAAKKKKLVLLLAGGGGFVVVIVVVLILMLGGKKKADPVEEFASSRPKAAAPKAVDPKVAREEAAKKAFEDAMLVFKAEPENIGAQMRGLRSALEAAKDTSYPDQILRQIEILGIKIQEKIAGFKPEYEPHFKDEKFKALFDVLEQK